LHEAGPSWAPLTLDPIATHIELLKGVAYLLAFVTALRIARQREGVRFVAGAIVVSGIVLAASALLHPAFGAHKLFGVYEPEGGISERHLAPLMNPNNLAGYLNVSLCLALAAALAPEPYLPRVITGTVALLLGATQVWVASRGGVVAMGLGVVVVIAIERLARSRPQGAVATLSLITGLVTAAGATFIVLGGSDEASTELLDADVSKLKMFASAMRMLPAVPIFGCGRGAFESAFPAFRTSVGHMTFAYPENVVAQWILEWGLPVSLMGLAAIAFALRPSAVLARSTTAAGAWAAIIAITVQNLGDLGTEVPGLVLAGVACAAIVVAGTPGHRPRWGGETWSQRPRYVAICGSATAVLGIILAASGLGRELWNDQRRLYEAVGEPHTPISAIYARARAAMLRHPSEPYLPFITALRVWESHEGNPMPWIGATLERAAVYGPAHWLLAHVVARRSPSQARMEYRLAIEQMPEAPWLALQEAPAVIGGYDDAMEVVPGGKLGVAALESLVGALADRLPATRVRLDAELAVRSPKSPGPATRAALDAVEDLETAEGAPWCEGLARAACIRRALEQSTLAQRLSPDKCDGYALRTRARVAIGEVAAGLDDLEKAVDVVSDRVACLQKLESIARTVGDERRAQEALDRVTNAGCADDAECVRNLSWAAQREGARGNSRKALALYKRAHQRAPQDDALLETIAGLAAAVGLHGEASDDYEQLVRLHPQDSHWKLAAQQEKDAATRAVVGL
jgi:tetratricopeptide (TPR) repeat protein